MTLFTARGERSWVPGWAPESPAGEPPAEAAEEEGTVFVTQAGGRSTFWVVAARWADGIRYARVTPGVHAGTVEVRRTGVGPGATQIDVTYDLTALGPDGTAPIDEFAAGYDREIAGWEDAIGASLAGSGGLHG